MTNADMTCAEPFRQVEITVLNAVRQSRQGLRPRVTLGHNLFKPASVHVCINLCRLDIAVPKQFLYDAQVGAACQ